MLRARYRRRLAVAVAVGAVLAGAAGCGGDDEPSSSSSSSSGGSGEPIKVGMITTLGTSTLDFSQHVAATKASVQAINDAGGVNGRDLELLVCNDQADPNTAATCARDHVQDGVVAEINLNSLTGGVQVGQVLKAAKVPSVMATAYLEDHYQDPGTYLTNPGFITIYAGCVPWAQQTKSPDMAIGFLDGLAAGTVAANSVASAAQTADIPVPGKVGVPITAGDMSSYVQQFKNTGAASACMTWPPNLVVPYLKTADQLGLQSSMTPIFTLSVLSPSAIKSAGPAAEGTGTISLYPPQDAVGDFPGLQQFEKEMDTQEATGDKDAAADRRDDVSIANWLTPHALAGVLDQAGGDGELTPASVTEALNSAKDVDMLGLSPPWTPNAQGPEKYPRVGGADGIYIGEVKDGQVQLLQDEPVSLQQFLQ